MSTETATAFDVKAFRRALGRFATGVTVITTTGPDGRPEGMTANSFTALSLEPPLVLWCIRREAPSRPAFESCSHFAVNVLALEQRDLSGHFATPAKDKFTAVRWRSGIGGAPLLDGAIASFECERSEMVEGGDHLIVVGEVQRFEYRDGEPLAFSNGRYARAVPEPAAPGDGALVAEFSDLLL